VVYVIPNIRNFLFKVGFLALVPGLGWSQIALVNVTSCGRQTFPGSCTVSSSSSGNLIVVGFQLAGGSNTTTTLISVTDNVGNLYSEAGAARSVDTAEGSMVDIWYAKNSVSGAISVTITPNLIGQTGGAVIWELSGVDATSPLNQTSVLNSQATSTTPTGASVTTASANQLIISLVAVANTITGIAPGNTFTNDSAVLLNGWAHLITSSTGTYSAQWTQSPSGTYASSTASFNAAASGTGLLNACDLAAPYGTIDTADVQAAINMTLGISPCTANIAGAGVCNAAVVQRVINASLPGGMCVTGTGATPHSVSLKWTASTTPNVTYNVYRSTTSGSYSWAPLASAGAATSYTDYSVQAGVTYYYVVTAVSGSSESGRSNETPATIPTP